MHAFLVQLDSRALMLPSHQCSATKGSTVQEASSLAQRVILDIGARQAKQRQPQLLANVRSAAIAILHHISHTAQLALMVSRSAAVPSAKLMDAACVQPPNTAPRARLLQNHARQATGAAKELAMHTSILVLPVHMSRRQEAQRRMSALTAPKGSIAQRGRPIVTKCARPDITALLTQERGTSIRARSGHSAARSLASSPLHNAKHVQQVRTVHRAPLSQLLARWVHTTLLARLDSWAIAFHA